MLRRCFLVFILLFAVSTLAQQGMGNDCTPAGTWYGGSVVAYQLTVAPSAPAGHYTFIFQGIYTPPPPTTIAAFVSGEMVKKGNVYEGSMLSLGGDNAFLNPNPAAIGKMPDLEVGWVSMEMVDCNTIKNVIPFFGIYFGPFGLFDTGPGPGIWQPGSPGSPFFGVNWTSGGKVPLVNEPDVDLIPILTGDTKPIVETYHRLLNKPPNPNLNAWHHF